MVAINKILIIRFSSIGDILLSSPLIRILREKFPNAEIDYLTKSDYADLVKFNPNITSVIELRTDLKDELRKLKEQIRNSEYDVILDIHNSLRSRYIRFLSGAKYKGVVNKKILKRFLLVTFKWNFYKDIISVADRYIEAARELSIENDGRGLEIFVPEENVLTVNAMLDKYKLNRYNVVIGIAPCAKHFTKCWLQNRFIELGWKLTKLYGAKILIFGSKNEQDYCNDVAQMINVKASASVAESLAGKLTLLETAAALDHCSLVITNDSGIMHLAAARKKKIIAVFGSTVKEFGFYPYGTDYIIVEAANVKCRPCSHIGLAECPKKHFRCMNEVQVEDVLNNVKRFFN
jgi:lipopolysaccharide heptosyltransferase II